MSLKAHPVGRYDLGDTHPHSQPSAPRGGGSIVLVSQAFEPGQHLATFCAGRADVGAVVSFAGLCRVDAGVTALELEAYPGFTERAIAAEAEAVAADHALLDLAVVHRVGRIGPGEAIVFVATAAAHRRAAFDGCDRMMDFLKSRAPFWKREHAAGGARWVEPTARDLADAARWDAAPGDRPVTDR